MQRFFSGLAVGVLLVLCAAGGMGLVGGTWGAERHVALAFFALLLCCFVQVAVFTYFVVTGKMIAQALHLGGFDLAVLGKSRLLKRSVMRRTAAVFGAVLAAAGTGASHWRGGGGATGHLLAVGALLVVQTVVFYQQWDLIARNAALFDEAMGRYAARRAA